MKETHELAEHNALSSLPQMRRPGFDWAGFLRAQSTSDLIISPPFDFM
jgi:hypothetical protein